MFFVAREEAQAQKVGVTGNGGEVDKLKVFGDTVNNSVSSGLPVVFFHCLLVSVLPITSNLFSFCSGQMRVTLHKAQMKVYALLFPAKLT